MNRDDALAVIQELIQTRVDVMNDILEKTEVEDSQYWMAQIQIFRDVMRYVRENLNESNGDQQQMKKGKSKIKKLKEDKKSKDTK